MQIKTIKRCALLAILLPIPLFLLSWIIVQYLYSLDYQGGGGILSGVIGLFVGFGMLFFRLLHFLSYAGILLLIPIGLIVYIWLGLRGKGYFALAKKWLKKGQHMSPATYLVMSIPTAFFGFGALSHALMLLFEGTYTFTIIVSGTISLLLFGGSWLYVFLKTKNVIAILHLIGYQIVVSIVSWLCIYK